MNMVHYISQSCRNNLSLGESYSSWLTQVTHTVTRKMDVQALPNSQSTAPWRGEAQTRSNRYFLDGTFLFTEGLLHTQMSQSCWITTYTSDGRVIPVRESTTWHGHFPVNDPSNANRRKCEGKIEDPVFLLPISNHGTICSADHRHSGSRDGSFFGTCRICYSSHHSFTGGRRTSAPRLPGTPVTGRHIHFYNDRVLIQ